MIRVTSYTNGTITSQEMTDVLCTPPDLIPLDTLVWIDMTEPTDAEETQVLKQWLNVNSLVIDDMHRARKVEGKLDPHYPSVEEYETYLFVMVYAAIMPTPSVGVSADEFLDNLVVGQLNVILTERAIVTHHPVRVDVIEGIRRLIQTSPHLLDRGPDFVLAMILDALVRNVRTILNRIDTRMEELEQRIFTADSVTVSTKLLELRRLVNGTRRSLNHQDEVVYQLARGDYQLVNESEAIYYREVHDHHIMALDHTDALRDSIMGLMDVYFSHASTRLSQVMRMLTVISTIFLPITFITSLYGMNFHFMPELGWTFGYPLVLTVILIVTISMLILFRRRGWLG
ncbi:MAG: magnesium/cobalt transporter CorA [Ignavibacteria bacterium]|nr:magnesium/cobalt transporter CorA [Ignavibacteria bacterium]